MIVDKPSRSTVKLEVGIFKDGRKRYEIRHLDDIKFAHPDSLAAPIHRPKLGRPSASADSRVSTEVTTAPSRSLTTPLAETERKQSKQNGSTPSPSRTTTATADTPAASAADPNIGDLTGPPSIKPFSRPIRATRNPNPKYVDAIWSATQDEIEAINAAIAG